MQEQKLQFMLQGSSREPYKIRFYFNDENAQLTGFCNCPAGKRGLFCKHIAMLLDGDISKLINRNSHDLEVLSKWLSCRQLLNYTKNLLAANKSRKWIKID